MFISTAGFKRLIKEAHKGPGLRMGCTGDTFLICGDYWIIEVLRDKLTKKELGAIIELTGELPTKETWFMSRDKEKNQYEITWPTSRPMKDCYDQDEDMIVTKITLQYRTGQSARVLQNPKTLDVMLINEKFINILNNAYIDYDAGEYTMDGAAAGPHKGVILANNFMAIQIMPREDDDAEELLKYLSNIELPLQRDDIWE